MLHEGMSVTEVAFKYDDESADKSSHVFYEWSGINLSTGKRNNILKVFPEVMQEA